MGFKTKARRLENLTWAASGNSGDIDIKKNLKAPIMALELRLAGLITAGGGGTVSGLVEDAPAGQISRIRITGQNKKTGQSRTIYDGQARWAYWLGNLHTQVAMSLTAPLPTAAATGDFLLGILIPLTSFSGSAVYLDPRDYSTLTLRLEYGNGTTDYGSTNVSTITVTTIEVSALEVVEGLPEDAQHFEPRWDITQMAVESAKDDQRSQSVAAGGLVPYTILHTHDDSGVGNAQRVDGLVKEVRVFHGGDEQLWNSWAQLMERTKSRRGLAQATAMPAGYVLVEFLDALNTMYDKVLDFSIKSSGSVPQGITAITPASGDRCDLLALVCEPNAAMRASMAA